MASEESTDFIQHHLKRSVATSLIGIKCVPGTGVNHWIEKASQHVKASLVRIPSSNETEFNSALSLYAHRIFGDAEKTDDLPMFWEELDNTPNVIVLEDIDLSFPGKTTFRSVDALKARLPHYNTVCIAVPGIPNAKTERKYESVEEAKIEPWTPEWGTYLVDESGWGRRILEVIQGNCSCAQVLDECRKKYSLDSYAIYHALGAPEPSTTPGEYGAFVYAEAIVSKFLCGTLSDAIWNAWCVRCVFPRYSYQVLFKHFDELRELRLLREAIPSLSMLDSPALLFETTRNHHLNSSHIESALRLLHKVLTSGLSQVTDMPSSSWAHIIEFVVRQSRSVCPLLSEQVS
eukprot:PhF_6_TR18954/c0_g1_i2/m.27807